MRTPTLSEAFFVCINNIYKSTYCKIMVNESLMDWVDTNYVDGVYVEPINEDGMFAQHNHGVQSFGESGRGGAAGLVAGLYGAGLLDEAVVCGAAAALLVYGLRTGRNSVKAKRLIDKWYDVNVLKFKFIDNKKHQKFISKEFVEEERTIWETNMEKQNKELKREKARAAQFKGFNNGGK